MMIAFITRRQFRSGGTTLRSLQHAFRAPSYLKTNCLHTNHIFSPWFLPKTTNTTLGLKPLNCLPFRFCHGGQPGSPDREDGRQIKEDRLSMKALVQAPKPALYLGFSGLVPFVVAPLLMVVTQSFYPEIAYAQVVYGASIVSFLGGARWGFAIPDGSPAQPDWMNLGNSVVPSLLAWLALLCRDNITEGALLVIMGLGLSLHYDLTLLPGYPGWFKAMRTILTLVATFSLVATLTLQKLCPEKKMRES